MSKVVLFVTVLISLLCCAVWAANAPAQPSSPTPLPVMKINPRDGAEMAMIPAGEFLMGSSEEELTAWMKAHPDDKREWLNNEVPQHKVSLDAYFIYRNDVTVAQFKKFCAATGHQMPDAPLWGWKDKHPIVNVTWDDAQAYAKWAGAALPTEAQWEKAARGGKQQTFVWGEAWPPPHGAGNFADVTFKKTYSYLKTIPDYDDGYANTSPVGSFTPNAYGLFDMAGNVWQWCADWFDLNYYANSPAKNPLGPATGTAHILRGGSWFSGDPKVLRVAFRRMYAPTGSCVYFGFRCVMPSEP